MGSTGYATICAAQILAEVEADMLRKINSQC